MSTAVLEPPSTTDELRDRAEELAGEVAEQLQPAEDRAGERIEPTADLAREQRLARRDEFFAALRTAVMSIASSPAWRAHDLTTELLLLLERLRDELAADADATDPEWRVRETLQRTLVVLHAMVRQLEHNELDRPEQAARFVAQALADVEVGSVAALLGTTNRMIGSYRRGEVGQIRKNPARVTLVAQLVHELLGSMTPRGALLWFDARHPQLADRTPRELLDEDPATHRQALMALARGGRAQTDRGGARHGALDRAA
ncbi:MAG TPA: hypothetical protein VGW75_04725 [Solirubrobacteraceae bacterium]|jgi:hypothetical protein|nr:hypothetical protein [Solirubrobacteraceae bacterium]